MKLVLMSCVILLLSCVRSDAYAQAQPLPGEQSNAAIVNYTIGAIDSLFLPKPKTATLREDLVEFAKTLLGSPYSYGCSTDPNVGFDCSGYVNYVFKHFDVAVPRSSVEFTHKGKQVFLEEAKPGDLILFRGTQKGTTQVGHMGIVVKNDNGDLSFIHSSSGHDFSVIITPLNEGYRARFVKVISILD